jgi:glycosyltransferase involved in cell wall biosynthesis
MSANLAVVRQPVINKEECELSILMPCLNEAETLEVCIKKAQSFLINNNISGEVIIADNGSTDGSQRIAEMNGARVVHVAEKGYGSALKGGINAANGKYIIMGDADDSYDFTSLSSYVEKLRQGFDLVMGNRFKGGIQPGAMPPLHKYLGNPVLSGIGRLFFGGYVRDFHCGLRGFRKDSIHNLNLETPGMEFASEMVVKATLHQLQITEVPTTLSPDGRSRPPHLRSWRDGWRHLRFLLIYSPRWLFLIPGLTAFLLGLVAMVLLTLGPITINETTFDIHTMLYASLFMNLGLETIFFAIFSKVFSVNSGIIPKDSRYNLIIRHFGLERGIVLGAVILAVGIIVSIFALIKWGEQSFGPLLPSNMMRITIPSLTLIIMGIQIIFASFLLTILNYRAHVK